MNRDNFDFVFNGWRYDEKGNIINRSIYVDRNRKHKYNKDKYKKKDKNLACK